MARYKPVRSALYQRGNGALAYDPAVLLKIVSYGYYKGIVSSRRLSEVCERNVQFMALSADTRPHFTTIADFIVQMHREVASVFTDVLMYASELNHRRRDPAFSHADRYKERAREEKRRRAGRSRERFTVRDFDYDETNRTCRCPAGHTLYRNGNNIDVHG